MKPLRSVSPVIGIIVFALAQCCQALFFGSVKFKLRSLYWIILPKMIEFKTARGQYTTEYISMKTKLKYKGTIRQSTTYYIGKQIAQCDKKHKTSQQIKNSVDALAVAVSLRIPG